MTAVLLALGLLIAAAVAEAADARACGAGAPVPGRCGSGAGSRREQGLPVRPRRDRLFVFRAHRAPLAGLDNDRLGATATHILAHGALAHPDGFRVRVFLPGPFSVLSSLLSVIRSRSFGQGAMTSSGPVNQILSINDLGRTSR
jgi:hypothetical protein